MTQAPPTFVFGIGAQKAGTTWLAKYLRLHPDVYVPEVKEVHYFDVLWSPDCAGFVDRWRRNLDRRLAEQRVRDAMSAVPDLRDARALKVAQDLVHIYATPDASHGVYRDFMLQGRVAEACVADITPSYCTLGPKHLQEIHQIFAPAKFLFILRDPVARMWSQIKMHSANRALREEPLTPDEVIEVMLQGDDRTIFHRSALADTLRAVRTLPADCTKVMFYETMFDDTQIRGLCDFLDIGFVQGRYEDQVNRGALTLMTDAQRATLRWLNGPTYRALHDMLGDDVPDAWDKLAMTAPRPEHLNASDIHASILQGRAT